MQARETTIRELIQGERQFRVPLFQRPYMWKPDHVTTLWQDILAEYLRLGTEGLNHFIGSFVLAPIPIAASHPVKPLLVVDGQQRLITLLLALCAIRDSLAITDDRAFERYNDLYLINKWQEGTSKFRLVPTQADRQTFYALMEGSGKADESRIGETYAFFKTQLQLPDRNGQPLDLERVATVITDRLAIVDITTGAHDNVHRIFESLNAKGARLTQGDLIRNYVFMLLSKRQEAVYVNIWQPMEALLGSSNLQGFARADMQRRGKEVAVPDVYKEFQRRFDPIARDESAIEASVADMARLAPYYKRLLDPSAEPDKVARQRLQFLFRWGAQTSHPLLMFVYDLLDRGLCGVQQLRDVLGYIESFLVRRQLQGTPTNALNWVFVQSILELPPDVGVADAVRKQLSGKRRYWPTDDQVREEVRSRSFYLTGRVGQQTLILKRLELSYKHPEPVDLENAKLTIEHIMPRTLSPQWRKQLADQGDDPDEVHTELLDTIGNLTLTASNSPLSNNPFARKKQILQGSNLELNKALRDNDHWGRKEIINRANDLAKRICKIWAPPLSVSDEDPSGFDWRVINAAVEAVPQGKWTTFGDLAALSETTAAAVGAHMANPGAPPHGYRILSASGKPNGEFHWPKKSRKSLVGILTEEGVLAEGSDSAQQHNRLRSAELAELMGIQEADESASDEGDESS